MKTGKKGKALQEWKSEWGEETWGEVGLWEEFLCPAWPWPKSGGGMMAAPQVVLRNWGTGHEGWAQASAQQSMEYEGPQTNPLSFLKPRIVWELQPGPCASESSIDEAQGASEQGGTRTIWQKTVGVGTPLWCQHGGWRHGGPGDAFPWNPGSPEGMGISRNPELTELKVLPLSRVGAEKGNLITEKRVIIHCGHSLAAICMRYT